MIESERGKGTSVTLRLPVESSPAAPVVDPTTHAGGGSETLLVVEDNGIVRRVARTLLEAAGYRVRAAKDATDAITMLRAHDDIDLIVSDVLMPNGGGRAILDYVLTTDSPLPILYTSGYDDQSLPRDRLDQITSDFLQKPFSRAQLLHAVRALLEA